MKTTTIGSYPKPSYLRIPDWFQNEDNSPKDWEKAWSLLGNKKDELIKKACQEIIKEQETAGIDIITDGEVRRENYILYHCRHLKGIDFSKLTKKVVRSGSYKSWFPTITSKVVAGESFLPKEWKMSQSFTKCPVKITIPGPMSISDNISNEYYSDSKTMGIDLGNAINTEIKRLVDSGCRYIQVDEPLFARKPSEAIDYGIDNLERCFHGCSKEIIKIAHICCGYPNKLDAVDYPKAPLKSYWKISEALNNSTIDQISLEDAHRNNNLSLLEKFDSKTIILGVVKIASSEIETEEKINQRVQQALEHIDERRLILAPDCGLGFLPRELCLQKLKIITKVAKSFIN
jgi:5-methyltetrahydropteroyltriglutamate--homocysteine methyltransferase